MDNDELTEQEKREMELILYSLDKIAPFFKPLYACLIHSSVQSKIKFTQSEYCFVILYIAL